MSKRLSKTSTVLYGKNSVAERVKNNPSTIQTIFITDNFSSPSLLAAAQAAGIPLKRVGPGRLRKLKSADNLQGVVAQVSPFGYADLSDLIAADLKRTLIFLDQVQDPQNLGVVIRIAACLGEFAVVIPRHEACEVTDSVLHVACGGENFVPVARVTNLSQAVRAAKEAGYWMVGAVAEPAEEITKSELPFPLGIVMGGEAQGIRPGIRKHLDRQLHIPMRGAALSLNVAMACAVFCYEASRQLSLPDEKTEG